MLGLSIPLVAIAAWFFVPRNHSTTEKLAKLEHIDSGTLDQIFKLGKDLSQKKPLSAEQWDFLVTCSNDPNVQLRQEAFSAMSEARTTYYRNNDLQQIEREKKDVDSVRCFYVGHLIELRSNKWKAEADAAMNDKSEAVRELAKDAAANAEHTWLTHQ